MTFVQRIGLVAALAFAFLIMTSVRASNNNVVGYLYTINNDTQQNGISVFERNADGSLNEMAGSPFPIGGKGLSGGDIDEQGAIRVYRDYVLAVNPGSDSVAVLRQGEDGKAGARSWLAISIGGFRASESHRQGRPCVCF